MFTKYTDISLPKNYSGSRFKEAIGDTKMKTHRATEVRPIVSQIKTSVSPSFQDIINKTASEAENVSRSEASKPAEPIEPIQENVPYSEEAGKNEPETEQAALTVKESISQESELSRLWNASGINKLLDNIANDDLLLISLIILLAGDSAQSSLDAIIILALLLLYH